MDHAGRIELLKALMARDDLSAVVAFSNGAHHVDWADGVVLLAGMKPMGQALAVLTPEGAVSLALAPAWEEDRARLQAQASAIRASDDLAACLDSFLAPLVRTGRIGLVDLHRMPWAFSDRIRRLLGPRGVDVSEAIYAAAARKTDAEIENARRATRIAEETYAYLLEMVEPGMPECDVAARLKIHSRGLGADDNFMMFHAAPHTRAIQPSNGRRFEKGDMILAEVTPSCGGQFTQICRTVSLGAPSPLLQEKYQLLVSAMLSGLQRIRPGAAVQEICLEVDRVLSDAGYAEYCRSPYMNRRGHGLGISSVAPGNVALDNTTKVEPGMIFVVHPNQYIPEVGYMLCGEPVLVTDEGVEMLTATPSALASVAV